MFLKASLIYIPIKHGYIPIHFHLVPSISIYLHHFVPTFPLLVTPSTQLLENLIKFPFYHYILPKSVC